MATLRDLQARWHRLQQPLTAVSRGSGVGYDKLWSATTRGTVLRQDEMRQVSTWLEGLERRYYEAAKEIQSLREQSIRKLFGIRSDVPMVLPGESIHEFIDRTRGRGRASSGGGHEPIMESNQPVHTEQVLPQESVWDYRKRTRGF